MSCLDANVAIDFVDGRLGSADAAAIDSHVAGCANCRRMIAALMRPATTDADDTENTGGPRASIDGLRIGRFEVVKLIGQGGMGRVYEAIDQRSGTRVAVKTLRFMGADSLLRFKQEFRALADIEHPNLVSLGELVEFEGEWLLTMELVDGVDFLTHARGDATKRTVCNQRGLRAALAQVAAGLCALHAAGKVHRDIKPSNILVKPDGGVVILDFGLVHETSQRHMSTVPGLVGTIAYMAPEQAMAATVGPSADWYSAGVMLYQALTGELPFTGSSLKVVLDKQGREPPRPSELAGGVAPDLDELCASLLQFEPSDRPTGDEVRARLGRYQTAPGAFSRPAAAPAQTAFVGRDDELAQLRSAYSDVRAGQAVAVYVHGESGLGKSELFRAFNATLTRESPDVVVLEGRCYERESVPYKALDEMIDGLSRYLRRLTNEEAAPLVPRHAALLPRVFPVLGRVEVIAQAPAPRRELADDQELRWRVFAALRELFFLLAERVPLVCVIDDLQWADADSLLLLAELTRPPHAPPMLLLIASRDARQADAVEHRTPTKSSARCIELGPLSPDSSRELAATLLANADVDATVGAELIASEAHGHPLYIDELVRHASSGGDQNEVKLDDAIWARASQLPADARLIVELICVAGTPLSQSVIRHAAQLRPEIFDKQVAILRVANLARCRGGRDVETIEPYHDRVREAVVSHLSSDQRTQRHHRLAIALESAGTDENRAELLLRHLEAANLHDKAATAAATAARHAKQALAFDRAAQLFRRALQLIPASEESLRRELRIDLARCLSDAGRGADAAVEYLAAVVGADAITRRECQRHAAEQWLLTGHLKQGLQTLQDLLADVGLSLPRTPGAALRSLLWRRAKLSLRGLGWKPRHERELPHDQLSKLDVCQVASDGMAMVDNVRGADFQTRSLLLALKLGEPRRVCHAFGMEAFYLASQGGRRMKRAQMLIKRMQDIARDGNDPYLDAFAIIGEGGINYLAGNYKIAEDLLAQAERGFVASPGGHTLVLNNARLFRLFCLRHLGAVRQWQSVHDQYVRDAERRGDLYAVTSMRRTNNLIWLIKDQVTEARADLNMTSWTPPETGYHLQHLYSLLAEVDLAAYEGGAEDLEQRVRDGFAGLKRSFLLRIQLVRGLAYFIWGRCFLLVGDTPEQRAAADKQVEYAFKKLRKDDIAYANAYAALLEGSWAAQKGLRDRAIAAFTEAARVSSANDMLLQAACARRRHGEVLGGAAGDALIAQADEWMTEQGIVRPERITGVYAPKRVVGQPAGLLG